MPTMFLLLSAYLEYNYVKREIQRIYFIFYRAIAIQVLKNIHEKKFDD